MVFVLLVAAKLLFPQSVWQLARQAGALLGTDADFQAAFAAVGRAVSGADSVADSLQQAYTAVFQPVEEIPQPTETAAPGYDYLKPHARYEKFLQVKLPEPEEHTVTMETVSYGYTDPALPANATLELRNLGFSYSSPLVGTLTSEFGWRDHPMSGEEKFHYGVDLAAAEGSSICAFADGRVYATGESSTLGKYIMVLHSGDYMTLYAHCSAVTVLSGEVERGQKIAEVGQTGTATGPHLHFELHQGSLYLNPLYYVEIL